MNSARDLAFGRIAAVAALAVALALAGCGRKAGLDLPPAASAAASTPDPEAQMLGVADEPAEAAPALILGPDGKPVKGQPRQGQFSSFPLLDWLIK